MALDPAPRIYLIDYEVPLDGETLTGTIEVRQLTMTDRVAQHYVAHHIAEERSSMVHDVQTENIDVSYWEIPLAKPIGGGFNRDTPWPWQDREWLIQRLHEPTSLQEIANEAGCSPNTISRWRDRYDLQRKHFDPKADEYIIVNQQSGEVISNSNEQKSDGMSTPNS